MIRDRAGIRARTHADYYSTNAGGMQYLFCIFAKKSWRDQCFSTETASEMVFSKASRPYLSTSALFFSPWVRQPAPPIQPPMHAMPSMKLASSIFFVFLIKYIKDTDKDAKVVFIGPCTAKKAEVRKLEVKEYVDSALTFEELQALFDSKDIDIMNLTEGILDNASYFGRIFARSGGLSDAVAQALKEQEITDFELKPCACDGIEACKTALLKKSKDRLDANFIEGMACIGGCIGGAGCLTHGERNKADVDKYGREAYEKTITDAISMLK